VIRFIAKRITRNNGHVSESMETLDADLPILEKFLTRGGFGGGIDNENFDYTVLIGAEVRKSKEPQ
jgi:hypothetical protein